jgi:transketolase
MDLHLIADVLSDDFAMEPIRTGFGKGLLVAVQQDERVVAVCADVTDSTRMALFAEAFPDRFIQVGIGEQNLVAVGSGLAAMGKVPFVSSYAAFSPGRNWEQIRTTIALNDRPVKMIGSHAGISVGADGATHQMLEDLALMRVLPNMVVIAPADSLEAERATLAMAADSRPNYMRTAREATPIITTSETPFEVGKAYVYWYGEDVTIVSTGTMTYQAMVAAARLASEGINVEVVHVPTVKPLDVETILTSAKKTGAVITVEEAQINGGLGGAISEILGENHPVPIKRIGMPDCFGESGDPDELLKHFGLDADHIILAAKEIINKK